MREHTRTTTAPQAAARVRVMGRGARRLYRFLCGRPGPCEGRLHDHRPRRTPGPPTAVAACPACGAPNALPWPVDPAERA